MKRLLVAVISLMILLLGLEAGAVKVGDTAPDFELKDLEGKNVKLSEYRGQTVLLVFGATWCPPCREEVPHLKKAEVTYKDKGLKIIFVDIQESRKKVKSFAKKNGINYTALLDEKGEVAQKYRVTGIPLNVVVDPVGKVKFVNHYIPKNLKDMIETGKNAKKAEKIAETKQPSTTREKP